MGLFPPVALDHLAEQIFVTRCTVINIKIFNPFQVFLTHLLA